MHFLQAINSDLSVLIVCNKTGGRTKGDIKKKNESVNELVMFTMRKLHTAYWAVRYFCTSNTLSIISREAELA